MDVVYDGVGGQVGRDAFALLGPSGRYVGFGMASGSFAAIPPDAGPGVSRLRPPAATPERTARLTSRALELAGGGSLAPLIGQRFALEQAAEAHAAIEARATIGKTLLLADDEVSSASAAASV